MAETRDKVKGAIDTGADRAKQATDYVADAAQGAKQNAAGTIDSVRDSVQSALDSVGDTASHARERIEHWAGDARDTARQVGQKVEGKVEEAYDVAAHTVNDFGREMTGMIRRYPIQSLLVGFGVGLLLGRVARA
ncbi:YtxH domain-containing protein [Fimbriiglobus ruber]|uniref:CsbD-like domain-containing protein n=1 Tax=Fimbriiglobus ruber TaxID=1908690 RepID=A0A225E498_9BACT|nr:YtxH domain-containing protein [Fimbriiglobus ruber]OWK43515.1 hypothetical protein FRUB_03114 [Fimbriiglobus ruber]